MPKILQYINYENWSSYWKDFTYGLVGQWFSGYTPWWWSAIYWILFVITYHFIMGSLTHTTTHWLQVLVAFILGFVAALLRQIILSEIDYQINKWRLNG